MDLYFKNAMYQEIIDAFDALQSKKLAETMFPREGLVLTAGACYKLVSYLISVLKKCMGYFVSCLGWVRFG